MFERNSSGFNNGFNLTFFGLLPCEILKCKKMLKEDSDFVRMIKEYIFEDIPTMYLEGFMDGYERLEKYRCKNIISAEGYVFYMAALLLGKRRIMGESCILYR